jgi:hypothetical protein
LLTTGTFRWRPITPAMSRNGTPSSATRDTGLLRNPFQGRAYRDEPHQAGAPRASD